MQIISKLDGEKAWMKEELERINQQLQKQTAEKEGNSLITVSEITVVSSFITYSLQLFNVRQSYCTRYWYRLDVCPSVCPSVLHTLVLCRNGST